METTKKIKTETTKTGLPALWEAGGGASNTGEATIVAGEDGRPKKPVYVKRGGHLANREHALIVLAVGDIIIKSFHKRKDFWIRVFRIQGFDGEYAVAELVYEFSDGQWDKPLPEYLQAAVNAATEKATCYHCRSAHYILDQE